eukprot:m51a1_g12732 putative C-tail anchored protein (241) ;mRNA; r:80-1356
MEATAPSVPVFANPLVPVAAARGPEPEGLTAQTTCTQAVVAVAAAQNWEGPEGSETDESPFLSLDRRSGERRSGSDSHRYQAVSAEDPHAVAQPTPEFIDMMSMWLDYLDQRRARRVQAKHRPRRTPSMSEAEGYNPSTELQVYHGAPAADRALSAPPRPGPCASLASALSSARDRLLWWLPCGDEKLGQLQSTAVACNGMLGSVMFAAGPCAAACGALSPLALAAAWLLALLYRRVLCD